jgi:non-ribosomal peptide synthetase component E (peptide arylation enzyme)
MTNFVSKHGVRIYSVLAALVPALVLVWPRVPWEALVAASAALLGVGVAAARHEDTKTSEAELRDKSAE